MNDLEPKKNTALEERIALVLDALMGRMERLDSRMDTLGQSMTNLEQRMDALTERVVQLEKAAEERDRDMSSRMRFMMNRMSDLDSAQRTQQRASAAGWAPAYSSNELRPTDSGFKTRDRDVRFRSSNAQ